MYNRSTVYQDNAFAARVKLAAAYISAGRRTTRTFDTCFEMYDGGIVATALLRRAEKTPTGKLAQNLFRYLDEKMVRQDAATMAAVKTCDLKHEAAKIRATKQASFEASMSSQAGETRS